MKAAIERLGNKEGFVDFPQGFEIYPYEVDHDYWEEGCKFVDYAACASLRVSCWPEPKGASPMAWVSHAQPTPS